MKLLLTFLISLATISCFAQVDSTEVKNELPFKIEDADLLKNFTDNACECAAGVKVKNKKREEIAEALSECIKKQVTAYQLLSKLNDTVGTEGDKEINIQVNEKSKEYKKYYYEIERDLMENCEAMKEKMKANDVLSNNSVSSNIEAKRHYDKGINYQEKGDYEKAIKEFKKALAIDDQFAFAWDNLGLAYRQLGELDKAIEAYNQSLIVEPAGTMPLQNLAIAYLYKEDFDNAIKMYEELAKRDDKNPEVYYGLAIVYFNGKKDYEQSLRNMCEAYRLYVELSSPYRTDAEKVIGKIYQQYKAEGKENEFYDILEEYGINGK